MISFITTGWYRKRPINAPSARNFTTVKTPRSSPSCGHPSPKTHIHVTLSVIFDSERETQRTVAFCSSARIWKTCSANATWIINSIAGLHGPASSLQIYNPVCWTNSRLMRENHRLFASRQLDHCTGILAIRNRSQNIISEKIRTTFIIR